jgi:peptidoglycan/LPS O-acetylase OafA/YrhL
MGHETKLGAWKTQWHAWCCQAKVTQTNSATVPTRLPSLDGWRALSILLVLGEHEKFVTGFPKNLSPAFQAVFESKMGVRFFFVISGFLISWLLLQEWNTNHNISLRNFYVRRALRILPVYLTFLATLYLLQHFVGYVNNDNSWIACLTFTQNSFGSGHITAHLWSLSIEEQFYILWPGLLLLLLKQKNVRTLLGITIFLILLAPITRGAREMCLLPEYPAIPPPAALLAKLAFFASIIASKLLCYADSLGFGCLAAILLAYKDQETRAKLTTRPLPVALLGLGLILASRCPHIPDMINIEFRDTAQAVGFSILMLQSILMANTGAYRMLNWKPMVRLGVLSYSIYIWQQLTQMAPSNLGLNHVWWLGIWLFPTLAIATLSYYAIERPMTRLRTLFQTSPHEKDVQPAK